MDLRRRMNKILKRRAYTSNQSPQSRSTFYVPTPYTTEYYDQEFSSQNYAPVQPITQSDARWSTPAPQGALQYYTPASPQFGLSPVRTPPPPRDYTLTRMIDQGWTRPMINQYLRIVEPLEPPPPPKPIRRLYLDSDGNLQFSRDQGRVDSVELFRSVDVPSSQIDPSSSALASYHARPVSNTTPAESPQRSLNRVYTRSVTTSPAGSAGGSSHRRSVLSSTEQSSPRGVSRSCVRSDMSYSLVDTRPGAPAAVLAECSQRGASSDVSLDFSFDSDGGSPTPAPVVTERAFSRSVRSVTPSPSQQFRVTSPATSRARLATPTTRQGADAPPRARRRLAFEWQ